MASAGHSAGRITVAPQRLLSLDRDTGRPENGGRMERKKRKKKEKKGKKKKKKEEEKREKKGQN